MKEQMTRLPFAVNNYYACTISRIRKGGKESVIDATIERARQRLAKVIE